MNRNHPRPIFARRRTLAWLAGLLAAPAVPAPVTGNRSPATAFAPVVPGYVIQFPRDTGSHPDFRTEWWYVTGWIHDSEGSELGFQVTFFRARPEQRNDNPSAFTARHIIIAHAALSDPRRGQLIHAQRAARTAFDLSGAMEGHTQVWLDDWRLATDGDGYRALIADRALELALTLTPTQPPLLQGNDGVSRKGPAPESASYYYSEPHLRVSGSVTRNDVRRKVTGEAWLDHEWSSSYLPMNASGWDWIGINLRNGGALMAFRMRDRAGGILWAGGAYRGPETGVAIYSPADITFTPRRAWRSPRTGTTYPVSWSVRAGAQEFSIEPLMDDQEHDTRQSVGTLYWEGAVRAFIGGVDAGRGYLELTGYWRDLNL